MLLASDQWRDYLTLIRRKSVFEIAGFDDPEAIELVEHCLKTGNGKRLRPNRPETWAKLKYDRQIAAIAVTRRVDCIYSTDEDLRKYAQQLKKAYCGLADLPLPPPTQEPLPLQDRSEEDRPENVLELPPDRAFGKEAG